MIETIFNWCFVILVIAAEIMGGMLMIFLATGQIINLIKEGFPK